MNSTPMGNRMHIAIFGKRNAGKSTLINAVTNQNIAVVSDVPGTTTDPVYKTMELLPIGPVVIIDTAGLDDEGSLGSLRIEKTYEVLRKTNFAVLVASAEEGITPFEVDFASQLRKRGIASVCAINKSDLAKIDEACLQSYSNQLGIPVLAVSSQTGEGIEKLKEAIVKNARFDESELSLVGDLIKPGDCVVLVTPIDKAAPKGRLILPQQQTIRDILEADAMALVVKEYELKEALESMKKKPALVVTDSQAFLKVSADTPEDIPLTSFSILFARHKGELLPMVHGLRQLQHLKQESKVLIVEGCTHHRQADDIGKVKIPRWIRQMAGGDITFEWASGTSFPASLEGYDAVIHCGGCMLNRMEMQYRMNSAKEQEVPITNYGMLIAYVQGVLSRALQPFPAAYYALEEKL